MALTKVTLVQDGVITVNNLHESHGITTTHIGEGDKLFYTDSRVSSYLSSNNYIRTSDVPNLETVTSLSINANILSYTNEAGLTTNIDLSTYLDDTNLARLVSGTLNAGTGIATFTRDDLSTFTIDFSAFLADANDYVSSGSFNTSTGVLTLTRLGGGTVTVDLDGKYAEASHTHLWSHITDRPTALSAFTNDLGNYGGFVEVESDPTVPSHVKGITTTNITNWNTSYGWGNHAGLYLGIGAKAADSELLDGIDGSGYLRVSPNSSTPYNGNFAIGNNGSTNFIQSHSGQTLEINPLGNAVTINGSAAIHAGNIGSQSVSYASNAGSLDSIDSSQFLRSDVNDNLFSGQATLAFENQTSFARMAFYNLDFWDWDYGSTMTINGGYVYSPGSFRAPIFYDSNNTGYYVDPASTSNFSALNVGGNAVITAGNIGSQSVNYANNAGTVGGFSAGTFYRNIGFGSGYPSWNLDTVDADRSGFTYSNAAPYTGPFIHIGASGYGLQLNAPYGGNGYGLSFRTRNGDAGSWNSWQYPAVYGINANGGGTLYATVYYDQDNTGYYVDPTNSGVALRISGAIQGDHVNWTGEHNKIQWHSSHMYFQNMNNGYWIFRRSNGSEPFLLHADGWGLASNSWRAPIFYDSNDTNYYIDPNADLSVRVYGEISNSNYNPGNMQPGAINIGRTDTNYNFASGSWSGDIRAGILANCLDEWEFVIHDSGTSVESVFFYQNSTGYINMGRDLGWGTSPIIAADSFRAPIFYDSNDTGYYVNPNGNSRLYSVDSPQGYVSNGNPWGTSNSAFFPNGITTAGGTNWIYGFTYIGNAPGNGAGHEFYTSGSSYSTGNMEANGSMRAPIFYDRNDTSYYIDGNSESQLAKLKLINASSGYNLMLGPYTLSRIQNDAARHSIVINADYYPHFYVNALNGNNPNHGAVISMTGALTGGGYRRFSMGIPNLDPNMFTMGFYSNETNPHLGCGGDALGEADWGSVFWLDGSGNLQTSGSMRAPIFYDSNNTGYYVDPASTSVFSYIQCNTKFMNYGNGYKSYNLYGMVGDYDQNGTSEKIIWTIGDSWNSIGNMYGLGYTYGAGYDHHLSIKNNGGVYHRIGFAGNAYFTGAVEASASHRAPIFYDSNNTGYYCDPNGLSRFDRIDPNEIYNYGWFRNHESGEGVYNQSTGQHFYSDDGAYWNMGGGNINGQGIRFRDTHNSTIRGYVYYDQSNNIGFLNQSGNWRLRVVGGDYALADGSSMRAQMFYDSNDTSRYLDPNGTSVLQRIFMYKNNTAADTGNTCIYLDNAATTSGTTYNLMSDVSSYFGSRHLGFMYNGVIVGYIGAPGTTSVNYSTTSSDLRLKKNIEPWVENTLEKFEDIEPKLFNFNFQEEGEDKDRGFIAQEMVDKFPEAYPHDNSLEEGKSGYYSFNPSGMVVYLMKALKEQTEINKSLMSRIEALENK